MPAGPRGAPSTPQASSVPLWLVHSASVITTMWRREPATTSRSTRSRAASIPASTLVARAKA